MPLCSAGDGVEQLLWRIQHGEVPGQGQHHPKVVVVHVGTNGEPLWRGCFPCASCVSATICQKSWLERGEGGRGIGLAIPRRPQRHMVLASVSNLLKISLQSTPPRGVCMGSRLHWPRAFPYFCPV